VESGQKARKRAKKDGELTSSKIVIQTFPGTQGKRKTRDTPHIPKKYKRKGVVG
jgi:hypothetical protein